MKAAIYYLTRSTEKDMTDLSISLSMLWQNFNKHCGYTTIIFHEGLSQQQMGALNYAAGQPLIFQKIEFRFPPHIDPATVPDIVTIGGGVDFPISYRHMCRFFAMGVYQEPILAEFDYAWHLDVDSFITDTIDYDVFDFMQRNGHVYGYLGILQDHPLVSAGLWEATQAYLDTNKIMPKFLHRFVHNGVWDRSYFYTNFEISRLNFWRSEGPANYLDFIDKTGGIYQHRWGDHIIHLMTVATFLEERQAHAFKGISYKHQSFVTRKK
jgi:hypothetical protein